MPLEMAKIFESDIDIYVFQSQYYNTELTPNIIQVF